MKAKIHSESELLEEYNLLHNGYFSKYSYWWGRKNLLQKFVIGISFAFIIFSLGILTHLIIAAVIIISVFVIFAKLLNNHYKVNKEYQAVLYKEIKIMEKKMEESLKKLQQMEKEFQTSLAALNLQNIELQQENTMIRLEIADLQFNNQYLKQTIQAANNRIEELRVQQKQLGENTQYLFSRFKTLIEQANLRSSQLQEGADFFTEQLQKIQQNTKTLNQTSISLAQHIQNEIVSNDNLIKDKSILYSNISIYRNDKDSKNDLNNNRNGIDNNIIKNRHNLKKENNLDLKDDQYLENLQDLEFKDSITTGRDLCQQTLSFFRNYTNLPFLHKDEMNVKSPDSLKKSHV